jgi:hypothetical protein
MPVEEPAAGGCLSCLVIWRAIWCIKRVRRTLTVMRVMAEIMFFGCWMIVRASSSVSLFSLPDR